LPDEEILKRLLVLNLARSAAAAISPGTDLLGAVGAAPST